MFDINIKEQIRTNCKLFLRSQIWCQELVNQFQHYVMDNHVGLYTCIKAYSVSDRQPVKTAQELHNCFGLFFHNVSKGRTVCLYLYC